MFNPEQIQTLIDFGLTETQARVYLHLNAVGSSDAKTAAKLSKVSRQDIYRVLDELFELGLLEKISTVPKEYSAISISECINLLAQRAREQNEKLQETAKIIFKNLDKNIAKQKSDDLRELMVFVAENKPVLRKARDLLEEVQRSIAVISPPQKVLPWLYEHSELFEKALEKNVRIRLITSKPEKTNKAIYPKFDKTNNFCIKYLHKPPTVSFGIYDNKKIILELLSTGEYLGAQALISDNTCIVELASNYFKSMWSKAKNTPKRRAKQKSQQATTSSNWHRLKEKMPECN